MSTGSPTRAATARACGRGWRTRPPDAPRTPAWVIVEKILAPGEKLHRDWRVDGTTGYTFMNEVNALLHDPDGQDTLTRLWIDVSGRSGEFPVEERRAR